MNANELADELERPNNWQQENNFTTRAATMLRQQQAEIETYKLELYDEVMLRREQQAEIGFYKQDADKYKLKCESQQAEIEALKEQSEDCTCQGGHSEAYLKAKGKLK